MTADDFATTEFSEFKERRRERRILHWLNVGLFVITCLLIMLFVWLSWTESNNRTNEMGVLFLCLGATAAGGWAGFLYATFGEEAERFKGPFALVNAFLGGALITDIAKSDHSVFLSFLDSTADCCGFTGTRAPVIWALVIFGFCGFMLMYYNKRFILNVATQRSDNYLRTLAAGVIEGVSVSVEAEPGAKPKFTETQRRAAKVLVQETKPIEAESSDVLKAMGLAHFGLGHSQKALEWLQRAKEMSPADPETLIALAQVYINLGKVKEATPLLEDATKLGRDLRAWKLLGYAYLWYPDKIQRAAEASEEYLKSYPRDNGAKLNLACAFGQLGPDNPQNKERLLRLLKDLFKDAPQMRERVQELRDEDFKKWQTDEDFLRLADHERGTDSK